MSGRTGRVRLERGLFFGVDSSGFVVNGHAQSGPKLYHSQKVATRVAGDGGTVFRVRLSQYGVIVERVSGPPVKFETQEQK